MLLPLRPLRLVTALGLIIATGCVGTEGETESSSPPSSTSGDGTDTETSESGTSSSSTTDVAFVPIPARDISLDRVQANQAVGIDIAKDGAWVPGEDRTSFLLQDRLMLLRGFWTVSENWIPRKIRAHLTVYYPDGTIHEDDQTLMIEDDAFEGDLKRTFYFGLMPEQVIPGIKFEMDLWETKAGYENTPAPDPAPRIPYDGTALVGVEDSAQLLKVVIVPFNYDDGEKCQTSPDLSEKTMKLFYNLMYMQDPVDTLEITIHDPVDWTTKLQDFNETNKYMSGLRFDEGAGPEVFYYGLIDACSNGVGGAGGKAYGIPKIKPVKDQAWQRVSSGLSLPNNVDYSAETFVHEVGHSLGRLHIDCGGAAGFDPTYPFPNGEVGEWGFGVIDFGIRHPKVNKDYMTYCSPTWVGNWAWSKVYPAIQTLTEWANEAPPAPDEDIYSGSLLVGSVYPDGHSSWITVPGGLTDDELSATDTVEMWAGGTRIAELPAMARFLPDGVIKQVVVRLPDNFDAVTSFEHVSGKTRRRIQAKTVDIHHTSRALAAR